MGVLMSPIRATERERYPANWPAISGRIRERSGGRCECDGRCGHNHEDEATILLGRARTRLGEPERCLARNRRVQPITGSRVVLTVAHLDHQPETCADDNLLAMCQRCHLAYDAEHHAETRAATRRAALATQMDPLFPEVTS